MSPTQMQINSVRIPNVAISATPPPNTGVFNNEDVVAGLWVRYRAVQGVDEVKNALVEVRHHFNLTNGAIADLK